MECGSFIEKLVQKDIIFLYETWSSVTSIIELAGYQSHIFSRPFQHKRAKRNSGGVSLFYKNSLADGIKIVKNHHNSVIWLKLDRCFFNVERDIYICGIYLWCEESPAYEVINVDFFALLETDIDCFKSLGDVYVCGDFNSRIFSRHDFILYDKNVYLLDEADYVAD